MLILKLIAYFCMVIVLPFFLWLHSRRVEALSSKLKKGEELRFQRHILSRWSVAAVSLAFLVIGGLTYIERPGPPTPADLEFFRTTDYKDEIDTIRATLEKSDDGALNELVRIFKRGERMYDSRQYKQAERTLLDLKYGQDEVGKLLRIDSYVVNNNLGVVVFHIRRNKNFDASNYLFDASRSDNLPESIARRIRDNIRKLDACVNELD